MHYKIHKRAITRITTKANFDFSINRLVGKKYAKKTFDFSIGQLNKEFEGNLVIVGIE